MLYAKWTNSNLEYKLYFYILQQQLVTDHTEQVQRPEAQRLESNGTQKTDKVTTYNL